jgi:c-di-GMP-binding flagellar brake protein YcgR
LLIRRHVRINKKGAKIMETGYTGRERRSNKRLRMNCTVIYRVNEPPATHFMMQGRDIQARMIDVSQGGMAMVTDYDIPVATVLSMRFTLLNVDAKIVTFSGPMEVTGEVRSSVPLEKEHRLGIYFTKMKKVSVG